MKKYDVVIDWKFVITFIIMFSLSIYAIFHITKNIKIFPKESKQELKTKNIKIFPKESKQELKTTNKFDSNLIKVGDVFKFTISSNPFKKQNYRYRQVIDIKDDWVQYFYSDNFPIVDGLVNECEVSIFLIDSIKIDTKQELRNLKTTFTDTFTDTLTDTDNGTNTGYNYENNLNINIQTYNTSNVFPEDFITKTQHLFKKDFPELNHNRIFYGSRCMYCGKISHFSERLFNYGESVSAYDFFYSNGKNPKNYEIIHCEYCNKDLDLIDIYLNRFKIIWE